MNATGRVVIACILGIFLAGVVLLVQSGHRTLSAPVLDLTEHNPIALSSTVELEKMTWMEVRDRIRGGATRVIVPTGGIEQNGPFVALNKHDLIAREVSIRGALSLGNTLVAPVVSFVPEGGHEPPSGHMRYPGTLSMTSDTFQSLLRDIIKSLSIHGFKEIILVADSFNSLDDIAAVASEGSRHNVSGVSVRFIREFYNYDEVRAFIKAKGIQESAEPFHEELASSLQLLAIDPSAIRYDQRMQAGHLTLGGVSLADKAGLAAIGEEILTMRAVRLENEVLKKPTTPLAASK